MRWKERECEMEGERECDGGSVCVCVCEMEGERGCHPCTHTAHPTPLSCRHPTTCHKNHISFYKDRHGHHASLMATHIKNEAIKGEQELPLSPSLLIPLTLLERATHTCMPSSHTLFHDTWGLPYKGSYFSNICSQALSFDGHHITANDVRHMFVTLWQDFISHPSTKLLDMTMQQMNASAADLMLNSTDAWAIAYDDSIRERAINTTLALWPQFGEFVEQAHLDSISKEEWDPLTIDMSALTISS